MGGGGHPPPEGGHERREAAAQTEPSPPADGQGDAARRDGLPHLQSERKDDAERTEPPPPGGQDDAARAEVAPQHRQAAVFDNPVEEQLESVSRDGFDSIVALRVNLSNEEVHEILRQPVEIYDDDDEETVAAKERTAEMKAAALDYIEAGGTFNQFLRDCQAEANEARETVKDVREEMKRILETEGEEAARAYLDAQNPLLRAQGLEEVHIGKGLLRMAERHRESAAAGER